MVRLLLLLVVVFGMVFWFLRPPPRPLPTEGVRLKGVEFYLFPEEEAVEWRFTAQEMVEEGGGFRIQGGLKGERYV
ncbi:hypothetical protein CSW47_02940, partial [Thermus scotoductus]